MTDYREIIRLNHQGVSGRDIVKSCSCSRNTVARILGKAREHGVCKERFLRATCS